MARYERPRRDLLRGLCQDSAPLGRNHDAVQEIISGSINLRMIRMLPANSQQNTLCPPSCGCALEGAGDSHTRAGSTYHRHLPLTRALNFPMILRTPCLSRSRSYRRVGVSATVGGKTVKTYYESRRFEGACAGVCSGGRTDRSFFRVRALCWVPGQHSLSI